MAGQRGGSACEGKEAGVGLDEYETEYVVGIKDNCIQRANSE